MFTIEQIKYAHDKVKSGADFPAYISEIKTVGVKRYETFVSDGHSNYFGVDGQKATSSAKYEWMEVSSQIYAQRFETGLRQHQEGKTDYLMFVKICAECGVDKWEVDTDKMSCTYFGKNGNMILEESIPG